MESRANYTLVGAIVIALVVSALTLFVWLSQSKDDSLSAFYTIYFRKFSLAGLQINSGVTMRGIKIGTVETLQISHRDIELVKVTIRVMKDTPIKVDTEAVVERNLLTGLSGIDLINSSQSSPLLGKKPGEEYPVIPEGKTALGAIQETLPQVFERASHLITKFDALANEENMNALSTTIQNLKTFSDTLVSNNKEVRDALFQIKSAAEDAHTLLSTLNTQVAQVGDTVNSLGRSLALQTQEGTESLQSTAHALTTTLDRYQEPEVLLRGPSPLSYGPGETHE